jgi:pyruvate dehydrogenase E2 component (dihydrolipoamide acetyltransferase)
VIGNAGERIETLRPAPVAPNAPVAPSAPNAPAAPAALSAPDAPVAPAASAWTPRGRNLAARPRAVKAGARAVIAQRMRESLASTAQYTLHSSANASGLLAVRAAARAETRTSAISLNDLVAYCTVQALRETPAVNAEYIDGEIRTHTEIHLGFACDTPRGLLVPVVRHAHALTLRDLAERMKALGAQAVAGTIAPDDLHGGTFTISNLGSLGVETFTPVINPPQVAILGVGAILARPVRQGGSVDFVDTIALSLTCDHQVVDGAPGARFLRSVVEKIETVESLVSDALRS